MYWLNSQHRPLAFVYFWSPWEQIGREAAFFASNKKYKKITQFVQMLRQGLSDQVLSDISRRACTT
jgi:hypothetical protein